MMMQPWTDDDTTWRERHATAIVTIATALAGGAALVHFYARLGTLLASAL